MTSLFWLRSLMRLQSDSNWEGVSTKASSLLCLQPGGILSDGDSRCSTRMVLLSYLISPPGLSSRAVGVLAFQGREPGGSCILFMTASDIL